MTPGGALAVVVWALASAGFAFYMTNFGSYNKIYGSLGGVTGFLVWLWISNIAILESTHRSRPAGGTRTISAAPRHSDLKRKRYLPYHARLISTTAVHGET